MNQNSKLLSSGKEKNDKTSLGAQPEKPSLSEGTNAKMAVTQNTGASKISSAKAHPWRAYGSKLKG